MFGTIQLGRIALSEVSKLSLARKINASYRSRNDFGARPTQEIVHLQARTEIKVARRA